MSTDKKVRFGRQLTKSHVNTTDQCVFEMREQGLVKVAERKHEFILRKRIYPRTLHQQTSINHLTIDSAKAEHGYGMAKERIERNQSVLYVNGHPVRLRRQHFVPLSGRGKFSVSAHRPADITTSSFNQLNLRLERSNPRINGQQGRTIVSTPLKDYQPLIVTTVYNNATYAQNLSKLKDRRKPVPTLMSSGNTESTKAAQSALLANPKPTNGTSELLRRCHSVDQINLRHLSKMQPKTSPGSKRMPSDGLSVKTGRSRHFSTRLPEAEAGVSTGFLLQKYQSVDAINNLSQLKFGTLRSHSVGYL